MRKSGRKHLGNGGYECGRSEDELKAFYLGKLGFQRLEGIDREARRGDLQSRSVTDRALQIVAEQLRGVIDDSHRACRPAFTALQVLRDQASISPFRNRQAPSTLKPGMVPSGASR